MGENRENRKSTSTEFQVIFEKELQEDIKKERRLFYLEIFVVLILVLLGILYEYNYPSDLWIKELLFD